MQINAFRGFSGSPVFYVESKRIVGVLTSGIDYYDAHFNRADYVHYCFDRTGRWNYELNGCLKGWKLAWKKKYNRTTLGRRIYSRLKGWIISSDKK